MTHDLKCWPQYFDRVASGEKSFELRKNDRDFQVGDYLRLNHYDPDKDQYNDSWFIRRITYILHGPAFGLEEGYCIMSLSND